MTLNVISNKVVNVTQTGGIIGMFISSPRNDLNARIRLENANGWSVVQVIPADSGNIFLNVFRFILLVCTLFLYTTSNGYYVIMEKKQLDREINRDTQVVKDLKCSKCGKEFSSNLKGTFCDECGNKL